MGERVVGNWVLEQPIGSGSFALVWRAHHAQSGALAAVKEINTDKLNRKLQESLASEISVLEQTKHTNLVGLLDLLKVLEWGRGASKVGLGFLHGNALPPSPPLHIPRTSTPPSLPPSLPAPPHASAAPFRLFSALRSMSCGHRVLSEPPSHPSLTRKPARFTWCWSSVGGVTWATTSSAMAASAKTQHATSSSSWQKASKLCGSTTSST